MRLIVVHNTLKKAMDGQHTYTYTYVATSIYNTKKNRKKTDNLTKEIFDAFLYDFYDIFFMIYTISFSLIILHIKVLVISKN